MALGPDHHNEVPATIFGFAVPRLTYTSCIPITKPDGLNQIRREQPLPPSTTRIDSMHLQNTCSKLLVQWSLVSMGPRLRDHLPLVNHSDRNRVWFTNRGRTAAWRYLVFIGASAHARWEPNKYFVFTPLNVYDAVRVEFHRIHRTACIYFPLCKLKSMIIVIFCICDARTRNTFWNHVNYCCCTIENLLLACKSKWIRFISKRWFLSQKRMWLVICIGAHCVYMMWM